MGESTEMTIDERRQALKAKITPELIDLLIEAVPCVDHAAHAN